MKACVSTGEKRKIEYRDVPMPELEPGTLLMKTRCTLICGADLEYFDGFHPPLEADVIKGHEFVAEVVEIGDNVTGWEVGERAVPISFTHNYGCWADYFVTDPRGVQKVPDGVTDEEAVFVEPLHTGYGAVEAAGLRPGQSVAVIGVGKIGLLAVMCAKVAGAAPIVAIDIAQNRLDKALEMGATAAFNANEDHLISKIKQATLGDPEHRETNGPDVVIPCARQGEVLSQAISMVCQGGHIVMAGFAKPAMFDPSILLMKQLRVSGIMAGRYGQNRKNGELAMRLLEHKQLDPRPLLSDTMPLSDMQKALDTTYSGENLAILLKP